MVSSVDSIVVEVVAQSDRLASTQRKRRASLGRVVEANRRIEGSSSESSRDVAEHATALDGGELSIITDQPDAGADRQRMRDDPVQVQRARLSGPHRR